MSDTPPSPSSTSRRPVCAVLSLCGPLLQLAAWLLLSTERGGHWFDRHSGTYTSGLVAFGLLLLSGVALLVFGLIMGVSAWVRREQPRWLAGLALGLNMMIVLSLFAKLL